MTPDISRKSPGSEESDFAVISCMMQSPEQAIPIVADMLRASDFSTLHAAYMFELIEAAHQLAGLDGLQRPLFGRVGICAW